MQDPLIDDTTPVHDSMIISSWHTRFCMFVLTAWYSTHAPPREMRILVDPIVHQLLIPEILRSIAAPAS